MSDLISLIAQRNAHASHRLLKTLKTFFRWCVGRAVIDFSPAEGISSPYREVSRDRVLTDQELAAVILSARRMPPPYGLIVEFLALTGQRREEVAQLKWDELDEKTRTWTIPGTRTKNKKVHIVHLSTPSWKMIEACSGEPYVFGTARGKRFQRFGREKHAIDKLCGITGWRLHDLRRTIVSGWRDCAFHRMSPTRSSTIKRGRFLAWRPFIRGTTFWLSARKRWIVGAGTSVK